VIKEYWELGIKAALEETEELTCTVMIAKGCFESQRHWGKSKQNGGANVGLQTVVEDACVMVAIVLQAKVWLVSLMNTAITGGVYYRERRLDSPTQLTQASSVSFSATW
jgi:hypothetical protein